MYNIDWFCKDFKGEREYIDELNLPGGFTVEIGKLLNDNLNISINRHGRYRKIHLHNHDYFEIEYVVSGQMTTTIDGNTLTLKKGDLVILNPYCYHETEIVNENDTILNIILEREFLPQFIDLFQITSKLFEFIKQGYSHQNERTNFCLYNTAGNTQLENQLSLLINTFKPGNDPDYPLARLHTCELLLLLDQIKPNENYISLLDYEGQLIISALNYIENNLSTACLNTLADELNITTYQLSKLFKRKTGHTFIATVQQLRFKTAYDLIEGSKQPITEIANYVGYNNMSFFYKKFNQIYGKTPNQIRK